MNTARAEQYRIEQVQILNWGGYAWCRPGRAYQHSHPRAFGRGKSTLFRTPWRR